MTFTSQVMLEIKNLTSSAGDTRVMGSILRSGRTSEVGNGKPLKYSCLENSVGRGAWQAWKTCET